MNTAVKMRCEIGVCKFKLQAYVLHTIRCLSTSKHLEASRHQTQSKIAVRSSQRHKQYTRVQGWQLTSSCTPSFKDFEWLKCRSFPLHGINSARMLFLTTSHSQRWLRDWVIGSPADTASKTHRGDCGTESLVHQLIDSLSAWTLNHGWSFNNTDETD